MATKLPQRYGKYVLLRKIAMGGMAEIFRAKSVGAEGFEKVIVIKRILPHFTEDEAFVDMFKDEARIASKLQHSNIVQIYDFDTEDDRYYIAMEYVEGVDLKAVIERGLKDGRPLSPEQVAWILMEASKGLHYAHIKESGGQPLNIVHRDISPHNLMVSYLGEVKLMDFGIAKAAQRSTKTMAGTVKGKCAYMSPEQARGKPLDGRSDLFALGIMMWEMLTHKRLFLGDSDFETLSNVLKAEVPPPSSINPEVPPELDEICLRALSKNRDGRQATVEAFGRELTKWFYSTVSDLDKVALKPALQELFAPDIGRLRQEYTAERGMSADSPTEAEQADDAAAPAAGPGEVDHAERTVALAAAPSDPQVAATLLDGALDKSQVDAALAQARAVVAAGGKVDPGGATVAMPAAGMHPGSDPKIGTGNFQQSTGAFQQGGTGTYNSGGSKAVVIAIIAVLLLAIGGGAAWWFVFKDQGKPGKSTGTSKVISDKSDPGTRKEVAGNARLVLKVDPYTAKVTADGDPVDGEVTGLKKGQKVRLVAEAPGYVRLEELVTIEMLEQAKTLQLKKKGADQTTVMFNPSEGDAEISVDGKKLGAGAQSFTGKIGSKVVVTMTRKEGDPVVMEVTLDPDNKLINIEAPKAVAKPAELAVTVSPSGAKVTSSEGLVQEKGSQFVVTGVTVGATVKITARKAGFSTVTKEVSLSAATNSVALTLKKKEVEKGIGTLFVQAKPWAKVSVDGAPKGTTPKTFKNLPSGKYSVKLTKGSQVVTKRVTVKPNRKASVFHDFSAP